MQLVGVLRIVRILRLARLIRLVRVLRSLYLVVSAIIVRRLTKAISPVLWRSAPGLSYPTIHVGR